MVQGVASLGEHNRDGGGTQRQQNPACQIWESSGQAWCHLQPMPGWCFVFLQVFGVSCSPVKHHLCMAQELWGLELGRCLRDTTPPVCSGALSKIQAKWGVQTPESQGEKITFGDGVVLSLAAGATPA